jgi:hypothetical protein
LWYVRSSAYKSLSLSILVHTSAAVTLCMYLHLSYTDSDTCIRACVGWGERCRPCSSVYPGVSLGERNRVPACRWAKEASLPALVMCTDYFMDEIRCSIHRPPHHYLALTLIGNLSSGVSSVSANEPASSLRTANSLTYSSVQTELSFYFPEPPHLQSAQSSEIKYNMAPRPSLASHQVRVITLRMQYYVG